MSTTRRSLRLIEWVERWNGPLTRFLSRRVPAHVDPEDLAQEVYLRLLRVEDLEAIVEPRAYLYHVARNIAAEWRVRNRRLEAHSSEELDDLVDLITPEAETERLLEARRLDQILQRLPPRIRAVTWLKLCRSQTHDEIAQSLGMSPRMVRKYMASGYAALRRMLVKER